jgi:hypothetical protein
MHIVIDAVGIRGHGGAAVLSEFMHWLPKVRPDWKWHVFLVDSNQREFHLKPASENVTIQTTHNGSSFIRIIKTTIPVIAGYSIFICQYGTGKTCLSTGGLRSTA